MKIALLVFFLMSLSFISFAEVPGHHRGNTPNSVHRVHPNTSHYNLYNSNVGPYGGHPSQLGPK